MVFSGGYSMPKGDEMIIKRQNTCTVEQLRQILQLMESQGHGQSVVDLGKWTNDTMLVTLVGAHAQFEGKPAWHLSWS